MPVTRTYARLPFENLSPERFEDLCLQIAYRMRIWTDIQNYGSKGQDGAIDIFGEFEEEGRLKKCVIQCKRVKSLSAKETKKILDDFRKKNPLLPVEYVLMTSCNPSRKTHEAFKTYAAEIGIDKASIHSAALLEAVLYARHPDIIYAFFGISLLNRQSTNVAKVKHRLAFKKKVLSILVPAQQNIRCDVIIHDVNRDLYPEDKTEANGISSWFKLGYFRPYYKGISFYMRIVTILYNLASEKWLICDYSDNPPNGWVKINAFQVGDIPYDNIVDFDIEGDEYYPYTHFYCLFDNLGEPYEKIWYHTTPKFKEIALGLDEKNRLPSSTREHLLPDNS